MPFFLCDDHSCFSMLEYVTAELQDAIDGFNLLSYKILPLLIHLKQYFLSHKLKNKIV